MIEPFGYQYTQSRNGRRGIRFLAKVDSLAIVLVKCSIGGIQKNFRLHYAFDSVIAGGETVPAGAGKKFIIFIIESVDDNIQASDFTISYEYEVS